MTTFIKTKFKVLDVQTNIGKKVEPELVASNIFGRIFGERATSETQIDRYTHKRGRKPEMDRERERTTAHALCSY
ncbi:MAG: hypothetical protein GY739_13890 [Mesoflavibacter sp.]|nr:hypothetical protein [Mesoflavibacter sp.]